MKMYQYLNYSEAVNGDFAEKRSVIVIPAYNEIKEKKEEKKLRVAAYCRVSTGFKSQQSSYEEQKSFYTALILSRADWALAGVYADEAATGTSRNKRAGFNKMIEDAYGAKIDYIITKSISRFARNTLDALDCIRQLKSLSPPVGVYFEKENIDTLDAKGELVLTILSALAQEESRSISDNIKWTFQKNFQAGKPQINLKRMIGYDKGEDGGWVVNEKQAETVRFIFESYVGGKSANKIAGELNERGITTAYGKAWRSDAVYNVLKNEKYVGDLEMQKTVTKDFLTHRSVKNEGQAPKYYVKNHHEPIVDRLTYNKARAIIDAGDKGRAEKAKRPDKSCFSNIFYYDGEKRLALNRYYYNKTIKIEDEETGEIGRKKVSFAVFKVKNENKEKFDIFPPYVTEFALCQSFMKTIYRLKREVVIYGEKSELFKEFAAAKAAFSADTQPSYFAQEVRALRLKELSGRAEEPANLLQKEFDLFLKCLEGLPDVGEGKAFNFDKAVYCSFILEGRLHKEGVTYSTSFGVTLNSPICDFKLIPNI